MLVYTFFVRENAKVLFGGQQQRVLQMLSVHLDFAFFMGS
jgi:hypothetical protein